MYETTPANNTTSRIETDLLGSLEVPANAYYGIHTLRAMNNFVLSEYSVNDFPELIRAMATVKKAAAIANTEVGALDEEISAAIVDACDQILVHGRGLDQFPIDQLQGGAGTSMNMNTNEVVANLALEGLGLAAGSYDKISPNDHVNKSQSTNDTYPTALRLAVYWLCEDLASELVELREAFYAKGKEFDGILKMGRTQLQDAIPMSLGNEFTAFGDAVDNEIVYLKDAAQLLLSVNLGGTAIGNGLNAAPGYREKAVAKLAELTGLEVTSAKNLIEATSDAGAFVSAHGAVKRSAIKLSKICNDLRLLSSGPRAGIGEINLPEMQAGSSIMPAKVNPVIPESISQVCFTIIGNDTAVTMAAEAGQLQLNAMEPVLGSKIWESMGLLTRASKTLREKCVSGITANEQTCRDNVLNSIGLVTYLNPIIGHHNGDLVGKECARSGRNVREVVLEMGLLDEAKLDEILSPENLLK